MSDYNNLIDMVKMPEEVIEEMIENVQSSEIIIKTDNLINEFPTEYLPFDIDLFSKELHEKSAAKNQEYREIVQNINSYDLAHNCIRDVCYKLLGTPVESFADKWLPILLRSMLGNTIHSFIQDNSSQFTEKEVSIKIPSKRFSGRLDAMIGPHILNEIKSLPYKEYEKVIKTRKPREADFYQTITYKYILENFLEEAKKQTNLRTQPPKLDSYRIDTIQFIYVAHDIIASDVESFAEILERIKQLKKALNSKSNTFFFITTLVIDVTNGIADPYIKYIVNKLDTINKYLDNNKLPGSSDPYIDTKGCFFCLYKKICDLVN